MIEIGQPMITQVSNDENLVVADHNSDHDPCFEQLRTEAERVLLDEPVLSSWLHCTVLAPGVQSFEDAVAATVCHRLLLLTSSPSQMTPIHNDNSHGSNGVKSEYSCRNNSQQQLGSPDFTEYLELFRKALNSSCLEMGHTIGDAIRADAHAVVQRDPATDTLVEVILFSKGYAALVCHRVAHRLWLDPTFRHQKYTALFLQSQASAVFGVDLHPLAKIGASVLLDHGTGIVVGETATIGDGCTILHGVTLGGTGKDHGDRHPKVGQHVLIGAGSSILGNIHIGDSAKIGAGSVVLRSIPPFATAVGAPAKIIGRSRDADPASEVDFELRHVSLLHRDTNQAHYKGSSSTFTTLQSSVSSDEGGNNDGSDEGEVEQAPSIDISHTQDETDELNNDNTQRDNRTTTPPTTKLKGTKKGNKKRDCAGLCPFREYRTLAHLAPPNAVTILTLTSMLEPLGCSGCEIGSCMFELDTHRVGYRFWNEQFEQQAKEVIQKNTQVEPDVIATALAHYRTVLKNRKATGNTTTRSRSPWKVPRLGSMMVWFRSQPNLPSTSSP